MKFASIAVMATVFAFSSLSAIVAEGQRSDEVAQPASPDTTKPGRAPKKIAPELEKAVGAFEATFKDTLNITEENGELKLTYLNWEKKRVNLGYEFTVQNGRPHLQLTNVRLRAGVTATVNLVFYPTYEGGTWMGESSTSGGIGTAWKFYRVKQ